MFNRNNKNNKTTQQAKRERKIELNAVYDGEGTAVRIEGEGNKSDLLFMYVAISGALLKAEGIKATDLVEMLATAEAERMMREE